MLLAWRCPSRLLNVLNIVDDGVRRADVGARPQQGPLAHGMDAWAAVARERPGAAVRVSWRCLRDVDAVARDDPRPAPYRLPDARSRTPSTRFSRSPSRIEGSRRPVGRRDVGFGLGLGLWPAARLLRRLVERFQDDLGGHVGAVRLRLLLRLWPAPASLSMMRLPLAVEEVVVADERRPQATSASPPRARRTRGSGRVTCRAPRRRWRCTRR